jgi:hypothetical protein
MKIQILRNEHGKHGFPQYVTAAEVDYPTDHKWTDIERQVADRIVVKQGDIELEWEHSLGIRSYAYLNRIFLYWGRKPTYFFIPDDSGYDIDRVLPLSKQIFEKLEEELSPFRLMIKSGQNNEIPKHIKKKIKQVITKILGKEEVTKNENQTNVTQP